jgi:SAM-dependent methyltransferase
VVDDPPDPDRPGTPHPTEDYDPRLVELYDLDNPDGPDHDYYRALADEAGAMSVLDLGCGTGLLTVTLARPGRTVVGVDPSTRMLDHARRRPGADRVRWRRGDSRDLGDGQVDYAVMTGNVAQHIPDPEWQRTLADLRAAAAPGALLAFESRNPAARAWESWVQSGSTVRQTAHGPLREWSEVRELARDQVLLTCLNLFEATGELVVDERLLVFRDREQIEAQLSRAGFVVEGVRGGWDRVPFDGNQPLMIFEARAA